MMPARILGDERLDRKPPLRRRGDHREIADAFERHRERARDRRRGQRQHVDFRAQLLQLLLLPHAEPVLLVDDDKAQILEHDVGLDELVRADHEVDRAGLDAFEGRFHLLRGAKARQLGELHRKVGKPVGKHLKMLLGEECRRHEHRDLLAVGERHERRAQRHLRLAEADIPADQPVHRLAIREVTDDGLDRRLLVGRLVEAETLGKGLVVVHVELESITLASRTLCVEVEELGGRVVRLACRALLRLVPLIAAELVQRRRLGRCAAVASDQVQVRDWNVELRIVGIEELQELRGAVAQVHRHEAEVTADPVLLVNDRVADPDLGEVTQHRVDVRPPCCIALAPAHDACIELGLRDESELRLWPRESRVQRRHDQCACALARNDGAPVVGRRHVLSVLGKILLHRFAPAGALGADQDARGAGREVTFQCGERILRPPIDLSAAAIRPRFAWGSGSIRRRDLDASMRLSAVERFGRQETARRQQRRRLVAAQSL
jgi:hypothetical protein